MRTDDDDNVVGASRGQRAHEALDERFTVARDGQQRLRTTDARRRAGSKNDGGNQHVVEMLDRDGVNHVLEFEDA